MTQITVTSFNEETAYIQAISSMYKEYISYYRKLATKTVYIQPEQQHEQ